MGVTKDEILEKLRECVDPELGINVVDLGLVYGIEIKENNDVKLTMTMTSPMCPVTSIILAEVQMRLEEIEGIGKIEVELVWEPLWSPDMISPEIKAQLGAAQPPAQ
ncbi:MAG: metal-sulfur cluster assembly factor [Candidatus Micrarchaeaceae archaeon]